MAQWGRESHRKEKNDNGFLVCKTELYFLCVEMLLCHTLSILSSHRYHGLHIGLKFITLFIWKTCF